jgi:hypothetical protein
LVLSIKEFKKGSSIHSIHFSLPESKNQEANTFPFSLPRIIHLQEQHQQFITQFHMQIQIGIS